MRRRDDRQWALFLFPHPRHACARPGEGSRGEGKEWRVARSADIGFWQKVGLTTLPSRQGGGEWSASWRFARRTTTFALAAFAVLAGATADAFSKPMADCIPTAKHAALDVIAKTPAIGQMTVFGTPFAIEPDKLRIEVDVFGPQSLVYRVDVTLDQACTVLATTAELENNPWYRR